MDNSSEALQKEGRCWGRGVLFMRVPNRVFEKKYEDQLGWVFLKEGNYKLGGKNENVIMDLYLVLQEKKLHIYLHKSITCND